MAAASVLFTGACRSGKSSLAQAFIERHATPLLFLATAQAFDEEMQERIARHQKNRGPVWQHVEEAIHVPEALERALSAQEHSAVLLDCVTVWIGTLMAREYGADDILARVDRLAALLEKPSLPVAVVSNEVGWGVVPASPMGRLFRDIAGEANQRLASACSHVVLAVCGQAMPVKPLGGPLPWA